MILQVTQPVRTAANVSPQLFPEEVKAPVQYGPRVQATAHYLGGYQLLPYGRLSALFGELFKASFSEGTLANIV